MSHLDLLEKIRTKRAVIVVMGLGYVGLPLAVEKAKAGFTVIGIERNLERVQKVNRGENYIPDVLEADLKDVVQSGKLRAVQGPPDYSPVAHADVITLCVPTPLGKNKQPDTSYIEYVTDQSLPYLRKHQLMVLESTTYPGTTEEVLLPKIESRGFTVGKDFYLAFSPERVDPGNRHYRVKNTPKVVGGVTPRCTEIAKTLYGTIVQERVLAVSSPRVAEMSKLLENTFRIVNVSLVNELAMLCDKMGIDIWEVIEAASTKPFGFMPFYPGPGIGGHCLHGSEYVFIKEDNQIQAVTLAELFARYQASNQDGILFLNNGIQALTWDPQWQRCTWQPIKALSCRRYAGPQLRVKTQLGRTLTVTDKHPMVVRRGSEWTIKPACQLQVGDTLPFIASYPQDLRSIKKIDLIEALQYSPHRTLCSDVRVKPWGRSLKEQKEVLHQELHNLGIPYEIRREYIRQNYLPLSLYLRVEAKLTLPRAALRLYTGRGRVTLIPAIITLTPDFVRLLGYYVAEGCVTTDNSDRVRFTFHRQETELINDLTSILDRLGIKYSLYDDKQGQARHVKVSSRIFGWLLTEVLGCGRNSYSARVPALVFHLDAPLIRAFLSGLLRGDGWVEAYGHNTMIGFGTCNSALAEEVCLLLQKLGIVPARKVQNTRCQTRPLHVVTVFGADQVEQLLPLLSPTKRKKLKAALSQRTKEIHCYHFEKSEEHFTLKVTQIEPLPSSDMPVYSMEVAQTHTFATSGGMIVHNCIPLDPFYLEWKAKEYDFATRFIELAGEINDSMPEYVVSRAAEILNQHKKCLNGARVLLLGIAYKKDVDDLRESPALKVAQHLLKWGAHISYHDPYIPKCRIAEREYSSVPLTPHTLKEFDLVIITTDHSNVDYNLVVQNSSLIYDTRNALKGLSAPHVFRLGAPHRYGQET